MNLKNLLLHTLISLLTSESTNFCMSSLPSSPFTCKEEACAFLNLTDNPTEQDIQNAFRNIVDQNHPDKLRSENKPEEEVQAGEDLVKKAGQARDYLINEEYLYDPSLGKDVFKKINRYKKQAFGIKNIIAFLVHIPSGTLDPIHHWCDQGYEKECVNGMYGILKNLCISVPNDIPMNQQQELTEYSPSIFLGALTGSLAGKLHPLRSKFDFKPCSDGIACTGILYNLYTSALYLYELAPNYQNKKIETVLTGAIIGMRAYWAYSKLSALKIKYSA